MPVFAYKAADRAGRTVDGVMEAFDANAVVERLHREDYYPLRVEATSPAGTASPEAPVGGSANPTTLLNWPGPVSNDPVTVAFTQAIGAGDALRTGTYSKTLTFTLSTTNP